jgi:hypothetical protein
MLDERTEVTAEYDFQDTPSGRDDTFGFQQQVGY